MRKISRNEQILLVILLGTMSLFFFTKKVHEPLTKSIKKNVTTHNALVKEITELREIPVETEHIQASIRRIAGELDSTQEKYATLLSLSLSPRESIQEMALNIGGLASDNGITIREMLPVDNDPVALHADLQNWRNTFGLSAYSFKFEGSYLDIAHFFTELTHYNKTIIPGNLVITGGNDMGIVTVAGIFLF